MISQMLIDAHTHLNYPPLLDNWKIHIKNFTDAGGKYLINSGAHMDYNQKGIEIADTAKNIFPKLNIYATVGFHPDDTGDIDVNSIDILRNQALDHPDIVVAIGECGIDLHGDDSVDLNRQQKIFKAQCELARELNLPLIIHSRDGFQETFDVLKDYTNLKIYFHCFGYGANEINILESAFSSIRIGFTNIITYKNAETTRQALLAIKKSKILTETDAPRLPPQHFRGQINYPHYVSYTRDKIAELLNISIDELDIKLEKNLLEFLGKKDN